MNTSPTLKQGGNPTWDLISIVDALDELNADHAFLIALYEISGKDPDSMGGDLRRLLDAYLDTDPREKLKSASDQIMTVARSISDRPK